MFSTRTDWHVHGNEIITLLSRIKARNESVIDLTESNPTNCKFSYLKPDLLPPLINQEALQYHPDPKGLMRARKEIAAYYKSVHQIEVNSDHIVITSGTSDAYAYVFKLLFNSQETLLTPRPSYPLLELLCELHDIDQSHYSLRHTQGWSVDIENLNLLGRKTKAICLIHPNNPTGSFVTTTDRTSINQFAAKHSLAIISDEVFLDYNFNGSAKFSGSFASNQEVLTFSLSGISKVLGLPQMKLSWMVISGPSEMVNAACKKLEIISDTFLSVNTPVQLALSDWMSRRIEIQTEISGRIQSNLTILKHLLDKNPSINSLPVLGGWTAVLQIPRITNDHEFCLRFLESKKTLLQPGYFYDFATEGFFVISLLPENHLFENGIKQLIEFVSQYSK